MSTICKGLWNFDPDYENFFLIFIHDPNRGLKVDYESSSVKKYD
jgi:hypothetical protein